MRTVNTPVSKLRPHPRNPRRISADALERLKRTITAEPEMLKARPVIALPDGTVIAGNQRLRAAAELGWKTIPTVTVDLDEATAFRWAMLDNKGFGEDDVELLGELIREQAAAGADLDLSGFGDDDVAAILHATRPISVRDPDEVPPVPEAPSSVRGHVYELGPHRVMCGDATDQGDVTALVAGERANLVVTDPPYGVDIQECDLAQAEVRGRRKDGKGIANDDLTGDALAAFLESAFTEARAVTVPGATWYVFAPSGVDYRLPLNALAALGVARHGLVWVKDRFVMGRADYHYRHENVIYGWTPGGPHKKLGRRDIDSVLEYARPAASPEHPTMKPVQMIADLVERSSDPGAIILDPFGGSGSTLIAAERTGRRAFVMEIDPGYCDVIRRRYEEYVADAADIPQA